jgi:hypothetical protein
MWRSIIQVERTRQVLMPIEESLCQSLRLLPHGKINGPFSIRRHKSVAVISNLSQIELLVEENIETSPPFPIVAWIW